MPIEPQIPLMALSRPVDMNTPSETLANIGKREQIGLQNQQLGNVNKRLEQEAAEKAREMAERQAITEAIKQADGDIEKAMPSIMRINPTTGYDLQKKRTDSIKSNWDAMDSRLSTLQKEFDQAIRMTHGVVDQATHQERLPDIKARSEEVASYLGQEYNAERYAQVQQMGMTQMQRVQTQRDALNDLRSGDQQKAIAGWLSTTTGPGEWDHVMNSLDALGIKKEDQPALKALFGEQFSPENLDRAKKIFGQGKTSDGSVPNSQSKEMVWSGAADAKLGVSPGDRLPIDYFPGYNNMPPRYMYRGVDVSASVRYPTPFAFTGTASEGRDFSHLNTVLKERNASPLIRAAERTLPLNRAAKAVINDPNKLKDPATQLQLGYGFVQALDTFQSTVREGELMALQAIGTKWEQWRTQYNRYLPKDVGGGGAFIPPEVAAQIARGALELTQAIADGAAAKDEQFWRQANVMGVGPEFRTVIGGGAGAVGGNAAAPQQRGRIAKNDIPKELVGRPAGKWASPTKGTYMIYADGSADLIEAPGPARPAPAPARPAPTPGATPGAPPVGGPPPAPPAAPPVIPARTQ